MIQDNVLTIISCEMVPDEFFEFCMKLYVFNFSLSQISVTAYQKRFCTVSSHVKFHIEVRLICACCVCVFMLNKMTTQICELEPQCIPGRNHLDNLPSDCRHSQTKKAWYSLEQSM